MAKGLSILFPKVWMDVTSIKDRHKKSEFIETRAKLGAQLVFLQEQYLKQGDRKGINICEYLKSLKVEPAVKHTEKEDRIFYRYEPTTNMDKYIKQLLTADTIATTLRFDNDFMRWLRAVAKEHQLTLAYLVMLLLNYGSALYDCSRTPEQFPPDDFKKIQEIKNHYVIFEPETDKVTIQKIETQVYTSQDSFDDLINKVPAGSQDPQDMSKYASSTNHDRKEYL